jgi:hypothetical protein
MDPQFEGRPAGKTMVLALADSDALCGQYEALFVESLTELGATSASLRANMKVTEKLTKERLVAELQTNGYDSIIVTRVLSEASRDQVVTTGYYATPYNTYWGYYDYGYSLSYQTATVTSMMEFELETNLYDVKSEKLVWTGRKVVYDDRSDLTNMKSVIRSVIKDLGKKGLL